ncbi:hypothetical protein ACIPF8_09260 [Collimonas sp. NPDC087041]|uniref:hypothetical protein n=1 Tax=Collimonas sp. NPDC087041 TaxID=3363960 RepID=UPI0038130613
MIDFSRRSCLGLAFACVLANGFWPTAAQARNTKLLLPVEPVFAQKVVQRAVGSDMSIIFGAAIPDGTSLLSDEIYVRGEAKPNYRAVRSDDSDVCKLALQNALLDLVQQARARNANALVGIVSYYDRLAVMNSPTQYECHAGATRAVVDLKARLGKIDRIASVPAGVAAAPAPSEARLFPPASGFADISDSRHIPFLDQQGREAYQLWLTRVGTKAFVIAEDGHWTQTWGNPPDQNLPRDPAVRALQLCYNLSGRNCQLYAIDSTVVYRASAAALPAPRSTPGTAAALAGE